MCQNVGLRASLFYLFKFYFIKLVFKDMHTGRFLALSVKYEAATYSQ